MNQKGSSLILGIVFGGILIILIGGAYYLGTKQNLSNNQDKAIMNAIIPPSTLAPTISSNSTQFKSITLPVNILQTSFGMNGHSASYPKTITISIPEKFSEQVSAYGAGGKIIIGLKDWAGSGNIGADGSNGAIIYPQGGSANSGPQISYSEIPACIGCVLGEAAKYFPSAKEKYLKDFPGPVEIPAGLKVDRLSDSLVRYTLSDTPDGLKVTGVAYYNTYQNIPDQPYFLSMETRLPQSQSELANALLSVFINQHNLK